MDKKRYFNPQDMAHIGIIVKDIDASRAYLSSLLGLDSWTAFDYVSSKETLLLGEPFNIKIAGSMMGPVGIELIQPVDCPDSLWGQFIMTKDEGVHHIAFKVRDFNQTVAKLKEDGARVLVSVSLDPAMCWCYIETRPGGVILELMNFDLKF